MKQQENKDVIVWREAASTGLVSSADRAYMKLYVIRSVGAAAKMRLPTWRARAFEAAGKQGCDCVA